MAQRKRSNGATTRKVNGKTNGKTNGKMNGKVAAKPRTNYKAMCAELQAEVEALALQIADVDRMLDAVDTPPNCGTINGRMVEYARKQLKKYGGMTNPGGEAKNMLQAVEAPVEGNGPPWSLYSS
jgi:hypothetical protein